MKTYAEIAAEIAELVEKKQRAYGDSFGRSGDIMRVLYPSGISLRQMADALTIVRVIDKLFRIATDRDALGESPWRDIMGYALLAERRAQDDARDTRCDWVEPAYDYLSCICDGDDLK